MIEFLGGYGLDQVGCGYIARCRDATDPEFQPSPPGRLPFFLEQGWDVARSLWDANTLIADLDVEYVNFDFPADPFLDPQRTFALQRPVQEAIEAILCVLGIHPLHAVTGRGHHYVWKIRFDSPAFRQLADLGRVPPHLEDRGGPPHGKVIGRAVARGFAGLGLVMEYLTHRVLAQADRRCYLPVWPTAVQDGPQQRGREMVSIDISEYGDPLDTRVIRVPFSLYLKPWLQPHMLPPPMAFRVPQLVMVATGSGGLAHAIETMRDLDRAAQWSRQVDCSIPDGSEGTSRLIEQYRHSDLYRFHNYFYAEQHDRPEQWPVTYDRTPVAELPPILRKALEYPNDDLLKPAVIRHLVTVLRAQGWHPRHIAGLIRSKYERNHGWLNTWYVYDAGTRADFYVRLFSGLIEVGPHSDTSAFGSKSESTIQLGQGDTS